MQTVRIAWVAAEIEAAGHQWKAPRELALAPGRWGVQVNSERGDKGRRLPDLVFWPTADGLPVAVVVEHGPKPRRERAALEGWKASIAAGQYAQVHYVADPRSARRLEDGAARVGLTATQLIAPERVVTDAPPAPAEATGRVAELSSTADMTAVAVPDPPLQPLPNPPQLVPEPPQPAPVDTPTPSTLPAPVATPDQAAERRNLIRELLGQEEPPPGDAGEGDQRRPAGRTVRLGGPCANRQRTSLMRDTAYSGNRNRTDDVLCAVDAM